MARKLVPDYPSRGEDREVYMIEKYGHDVIVAIEDIIPNHDIKEWKLERIRANLVDINTPVGLMLQNGKVCIVDGHHRVVCAIEDGKTRILFRVIDADVTTSNWIMKLIEKGI